MWFSIGKLYLNGFNQAQAAHLIDDCSLWLGGRLHLNGWRKARWQTTCLCLACWPGLGPAADSLSGVPESKQRARPNCPRPRSHAAGQPVSWHLRGAPQNSTSRRRRCARTTAASQMTKWLCPAAQPPPRKHHATGAATRGGSGCHSGRRYAWPVLQRFASSQPTHRRLLPLIPCLHSAVARAGRCAAGHICLVI